VVQDILEDVPINKMMHQQTVSIAPECTVGSLVHDHVMRSDERAFPVNEDGVLVGIVTLEDIRSTPREEWESTTVREIMTTKHDLVIMEPDEDAAEALNILAARDISQIPVVHESRLLGMLRRRDIVRWMQLQADTGMP
jgi:CBS domain-containing protein